jgi:urease gamma subunit
MGKVDTQSSAEFKAETERISKMLDQAYLAVVPEAKRGDSKFNANVIIAVVTRSGAEYSEGVKDGKVVADVEYQDAQAFRVRANLLFNQVAGTLTVHEKEIATDHFKELETSMNAKDDQSRIQSEITGIINEVREGAGILASTTDQMQQLDSAQYIENVRELLKQVSAEYHRGNYTGADQVAVTAYLDNFEHVEGPLVMANQTQLKNDAEQMMRIQLRDMIKQKVTPEQLDAHIAAINVKLDQAVKVVPEFPVGAMIAMASVIGIGIAATRFSGAFRRQGL